MEDYMFLSPAGESVSLLWAILCCLMIPTVADSSLNSQPFSKFYQADIYQAFSISTH